MTDVDISSDVSLTSQRGTVISRINDEETAQALAAARREHPTAHFTAVFQEPEIAELYAGMPNVTAVSWAQHLAHGVVDAFPPSPLGKLAPPPVVIGDAPMARHIVRSLLEGWSEPGWPLTVHCIGLDPSWARDAHEEAARQGRVTWTEATQRPVPLAQRIRELADLWEPPVARKATPVGPTVFVAGAGSDTSVGIAAAISQQHPHARVAVIVDEDRAWPHMPGVTVFAIDRARVESATNPVDMTERLCQLLWADTAWMCAPEASVTRPEEPIFAAIRYRSASSAPLPFNEQSPQLRAQFDALSSSMARILHAGTLELRQGSAADDVGVVLTPDELRAMATTILETLMKPTRPASEGMWLTALELAFRIPGIARRAGLRVGRPDGYIPVLTLDQVERLAPMVHLAYQDISAQTDNATGSPLAYSMWEDLSDYAKASNREVLTGCAVAHAAAGLNWGIPGSSDEAVDTTAVRALVQARVERLGELEHRRWALFQRRNGAQDHKWMEPWESLTPETKQYDFHIMAQVPLILADAGIDIGRGSRVEAERS